MNGLMRISWQAIQGGSWGALIVVVLLAALNIVIAINMTLPQFRSQQSPPYELTTNELLSMQTVANQYQRYVVTGSAMTDARYQYVTVWTTGPIESEGSRSYYGLLTIGDRLLLVNGPSQINESVLKYTGTLSTTIGNTDVRSELITKYPELESRLLPVALRIESSMTTENLYFFMAFQGILLVITCYGLWRFLTVTVFRNE